MSNVYVIAEIGINHNGDFELAKKLIKKSQRSGANAVKFQKRTIELVYTPEELDKYRESPWGTTNRAQKEGLEFSMEQYSALEKYSTDLGLDFIVSCWDLNSIDLVEQHLNVAYHKVASALATDKKFLQKLNETGKPVILSTGMCTTAEIEAAHGISAQYNFLPLDDSRYSSRSSLDTINLIKEVQSINKRAYIGLHVNACEKFYAHNAPNDPSSKYLPEILDYVRKQVDDYEKLGIKFLISTAHGYARGKKVPNNRDTPEIAQVLDEYGITLFDTRIRVKLMKDSSYSCAITDVGGILKQRRLGEGISLVNKDTFNALPKKTFIRFLTHPGNYHVDAPSVIAMRTF